MRQHITKQQWGDVTHEEKKEICNKLDWGNPPFTDTLTIGQIIEFLGDDLVDIEFHKYEIIWILNIGEGTTKGFTAKECIDGGWEAVKYKLRNTTT